MLENLDSIDWAQIQHSSGFATAFPAWIKQLRSPIPETRENARANLFEYSFHQGSIYPVTPFLIPFLIELAAAPDTRDRAPLLFFLASVATASSETSRDGLSSSDRQATRTGIMTGSAVYVALLGDMDAEVRMASFTLITALRDIGPLWTTVSQLVDTAKREKDPNHLANMIRMLATYVYINMPSGPSDAFARQMEPLLEFLTEQLSPTRDPRVQFQASLAHLRLLGGAQSNVLVHLAWVTGDVMAHPEKYSSDTASFQIESTIKEALEGLEYFPRAWRMAILAEALPEAQYAGDAHVLGYALLETVFFGTVRTNEIDRKHMRPFLRRARLGSKDPADRPETSTQWFRKDIREQTGQLTPPGRRYVAEPLPADLVALSPTERRMVRIVLDTELVWRLHSNLLEVYGLPVHRDDARALLDEADAANAGGTAT